MRTILAATAAMGLAIAAVPAVAQMNNNMSSDSDMSSQMTAQQKSMYDAWPHDKQLAYDGWDSDTQSYYWTLTSAQQKGWWLLTPAQQSKIMGLPSEQQARVWQSVVSQIAANSSDSMGGDNSMSDSSNMNSGSSMSSSNNMSSSSMSQPRYVSNEMVQQTSSSSSSMNSNGEYPVCTKTMKDNCRNPGSK